MHYVPTSATEQCCVAPLVVYPWLSSWGDGGDVDPDGEHIVRVREHLNGQCELHLWVPGLVNACGVHLLNQVVHIYETRVQREPWKGSARER